MCVPVLSSPKSDWQIPNYVWAQLNMLNVACQDGSALLVTAQIRRAKKNSARNTRVKKSSRVRNNGKKVGRSWYEPSGHKTSEWPQCVRIVGKTNLVGRLQETETATEAEEKKTEKTEEIA